MRRIAIGDIHGSYLALEDLLNKLNLQPDDELYFLGDYCDRFPDTFKVIERLIQLKETHGKCFFMKGNHDLWFMEFLRDEPINKIWLMNGGRETVNSYRDVSHDIIPKHLAFLELASYYHITSDNIALMHAGFTNMHSLTKEPYVSNFCWDRTLWETALVTKYLNEQNLTDIIPPNCYPKRLSLFKEIYIGHTCLLGYDYTIPLQAANVINIDTGGGFIGGRITAFNIDTKEWIQSNTIDSYYPEYTKGTTDYY